jgi:hypothetical protein
MNVISATEFGSVWKLGKWWQKKKTWRESDQMSVVVNTLKIVEPREAVIHPAKAI